MFLEKTETKKTKNTTRQPPGVKAFSLGFSLEGAARRLALDGIDGPRCSDVSSCFFLWGLAMLAIPKKWIHLSSDFCLWILHTKRDENNFFGDPPT